MLFCFRGTVAVFYRLLHIEVNGTAVSVEMARDLAAQLRVAGVRHNRPHRFDEVPVAGAECVRLFTLRFRERIAFTLVTFTNTSDNVLNSRLCTQLI